MIATSLKAKIILTALFISVVSLLLSASLLGFNHVQRSKSLFIRNITTSADVIAYNLEPMLIFEDKSGAREILNALSAQPEILSASLYKTDIDSDSLQLFISTSHERVTPTLYNKEQTTTSMGGNRIRYQKPIVSDNQTIGLLLIEAQITQLKSLIKNTLSTTLIVLCITAITALTLALLLSKKITQPIQVLVTIAEQISNHKSFSVRVPSLMSKEMNQLGDAINEMLYLIEQEIKQRELNEAHIQELNQSLENKVLERTSELSRKNDELAITLQNLQESRDRLVEQEKMASLGELVAGVAHEINTPVGIGITASSHIIDTVKQINNAFNENKLSKSKFQQNITTLKESAEIALNNLERAANLIQSFKLVAVDQASDNYRHFNLYDYLNEIVMSLKPTLSKTPHTISISGNQNLNIYSQPGLIAQLITNMVTNSLSHAFNGIEKGEIAISVNGDDENIELVYEDTGTGVKESDMHRLFAPFFTTKRGSGGSGLGAHIMFNIVNHALHGNIKAESPPGKGLRYTIRFPTKHPEKWQDSESV